MPLSQQFSPASEYKDAKIRRPCRFAQLRRYRSIEISYREDVLARITHNFDVSRHAFTPVPAVDSTVVTLAPFPVLPWPPCDERWLFRLVKSAFAHRRKTLRANLLAAFSTTLTRTVLTSVFTDLDLHEHARAQELHVQQFVQLAQALQSLPGAEGEGEFHERSLTDAESPP